eukprot:385216_1
MSTQYGSWVLKCNQTTKTNQVTESNYLDSLLNYASSILETVNNTINPSTQLETTPSSYNSTQPKSKLYLVLYYWKRNNEFGKLPPDLTIFDLIVNYCSPNQFWIVFNRHGIFGWQLSSSNTMNRLEFGSLESAHFASRYHIDCTTNIIYRFGDTSKQIESGIFTGNKFIWTKLGKTPRCHWDYKKILIFNNRRIFLTESHLTIPALFGAIGKSNYKIIDFDLTKRKFNSEIFYGKYLSHKKLISSCFQQINNESILFSVGEYNDTQLGLFYPNKTNEKRFEIINCEMNEKQNIEFENCYFSPYNVNNSNNLYCGNGSKLDYYNLYKNKWISIGSNSNFSHINYSR